MAEKSTLAWTTGSLGDGLNPYTQQEWQDFFRRTFIGGANEGVAKNYANGLAVSGTASPVSIATGAAVAYGNPYENTAIVTVAIPTPSVSTRVDYIVLRVSWAAATVRITRIAGTEGAGAPTLTQTPGTTYDIPLATASITIGGAITVTNQRVFLHPNIEVSTGMLAAGAATPQDGWNDHRGYTWVYDSATQFRIVDVNLTAQLRKGAKVRLKQGAGYLYFYVVSSSLGAGDTTVVITGGSDYSLANAAITDNYISYIENPEGFPDWFNWAANPTGFASFTNNLARFKAMGKLMLLELYFSGTSNATTKSATAPVPAAATPAGPAMTMIAQDNGGAFTWGRSDISPGSGTINFWKDPNTSAWTASGGCTIHRHVLAYEW